ncbi:hypothetical protein BMF89_01715 [Arthrobacter sp. SRS-W-1-2016]|uniref:hypothetical protein n=1 Tax=Arthrobacter sp. SRS-W-1-2016 TaxID=1930254 RepID=UPI0009CC7597|nr:hypothetical protein [Arthrobacter sp. SRS-W-1-2016]OOP64878.1 hypothetical protein BMF89_01715 [Arthrobacter sp. SRS-W-1-2016]
MAAYLEIEDALQVVDRYRFHPLIDGNKRAAWTLLVLLLWINGYTVMASRLTRGHRRSGDFEDVREGPAGQRAVVAKGRTACASAAWKGL